MAKLEMQDYINCLQAKKQEAHDKQWLYIEVNAKDLLEECEMALSWSLKIRVSVQLV